MTDDEIRRIIDASVAVVDAHREKWSLRFGYRLAPTGAVSFETANRVAPSPEPPSDRMHSWCAHNESVPHPRASSARCVGPSAGTSHMDDANRCPGVRRNVSGCRFQWSLPMLGPAVRELAPSVA